MKRLLVTVGLMFLCGFPGAAHAESACPTSGITASSGTISLSSNCSITGNVVLSGTASITMTGATLTIAGNVTLSNTANLTVNNGTLVFPQTTYWEYQISLSNSSTMTLNNSTVVTNGTSSNNFAVTINAYNTSAVTVTNSKLSDTLSWVLANFFNQSQLTVSDSTKVPTEIYPNNSAIISISDSTLGTLWLNFLSGTTANITAPQFDSTDNFNFTFGDSGGFAYKVSVTESNLRLGLNSYPGSSLTVNGVGPKDVNMVFGYYVQNNTGPVTITGLKGGTGVTEKYTDQGRLLSLNKANINPFAWQVYVTDSNGYTTTVNNSNVNELAAFTDGLISVSNSALQMAVAGAEGPGSQVTISNTQIWSQSIQAANGGKMKITGSTIHGNFITSKGTGSSIAFTTTTGDTNGTTGMSCGNTDDGYPPNTNGVPTCNPYNPIGQCSQVVTSSAGVVTGLPACK